MLEQGAFAEPGKGNQDSPEANRQGLDLRLPSAPPPRAETLFGLASLSVKEIAARNLARSWLISPFRRPSPSSESIPPGAPN